MIVSSFSFFLIFFVLIGVLSTLKNKHSSQDYLLASRSEKSWVIALSAVATNNSGYMFIGMIGYTYFYGLSTIWIALAILIGDFCASLFIHRKMRFISQKQKALSFIEVISRWDGHNYKKLRFLGSLILIVFLSMYAAAQFKAGGKALHVLFGTNYVVGSLIGALVVLAYTAGGGLRASIWTNSVQSFVMIFSMALIFFASLVKIGGFDNLSNYANSISSDFFSLMPSKVYSKDLIGFAIFIFGWFFAGFGVVGQPHVMTSFMALSRPNSIKEVRFYYYSWYIIFYLLTIGVGIMARILIPINDNFDFELAMPSLTQLVLPDALIGFALAGLFAATMSTADSQIISCSAAISNDLMATKHPKYKTVKLTTILVTIFAAIIAIIDNQSVFSLAMLSWLMLACAFTPILIIYSLGGKMSEKLAISVMLVGVIVMLVWRYTGLGEGFYEAAPAILSALAFFLVYKFFKKR